MNYWTVWIILYKLNNILVPRNSRYLLAKVVNDGKAGLGAGNPVDFPSIKFNEGMHYTNGVFLIFDPGYYQVTVNLLPLTGTGTIEADIMVNNKHGNGFGKGTDAGLNMSSIVKLELYDSVNVRIRKGTTDLYQDANNFQIQKINFNNYWSMDHIVWLLAVTYCH